MNLPIRYFILHTSETKYLLSSKIIIITNILHINFSLYIFKDKESAILFQNNLQKNPELINLNIFPLELIYEKNQSLNEIADFTFYLEKILKSIKTNYSQIELTPNFKIYLTKKDIFVLLSFCKQFIEHYDFFKIELIKIDQKNQETEKQEIKSVFQEPQKENIITKQDINQKTDILTEFLELSPNNLCTYFICKHLKSEPECLQIKNENKKLFIFLNHLINFELKNYSLSIKNDLDSILCSFNLQLEEYKSKVIRLFQLFTFIIKNNLEDDIIKAKCLKIFTFLIFIYGIKILEQTINNNLNLIFPNIVHKIMNSVLKKYPSSEYNQILFSVNKNISDIKETNIINELINKYNYLMKIDENEFIKTIICEIQNENIENKNNGTLILNNPKIINIENFFTNRNDSLLSFSKIKSPDYLKKHNIISHEYLQLLQLNNSEYATIINLNPIISKFSDIILNTIFININKNFQDLFNKKISTLILMNKFITPNINQNISNYNKLFILYRTVIPYMYDNYKIKTFIDYFF